MKAPQQIIVDVQPPADDWTWVITGVAVPVVLFIVGWVLHKRREK